MATHSTDSTYATEVRITASPKDGKEGSFAERIWHLTTPVGGQMDYMIHAGNAVIFQGFGGAVALPLHVSPADDYTIRVHVNGRELPTQNQGKNLR